MDLFMDISLITKEEGTQIIPSSVCGMLWLQTHFEEEYWEALANSEVRIENTNATELTKDAQEAGLIVNSLPVTPSIH